MAKPFLKWAGGKTQLLPVIQTYYPNNIQRYCEPFVGGGAVLFDVLSRHTPKEVLINDINTELINCYNQIKNRVTDVSKILLAWQNDYLKADTDKRKSLYLEKRALFNLCIEKKEYTAESAALMIFLNKTCFNGLYRVNAKGLFNVPSGAYKNPTIANTALLQQVSQALKNVNIISGPYSQTLDFVNKNTFVYIDPPYRPLNTTASFNTYAKETFGDNEQIQLCHFANLLHQKGAIVLLSNSDPKNTNPEDAFFDDLYQAHTLHRISANRMINSKASNRGPISELLIRFRV